MDPDFPYLQQRLHGGNLKEAIGYGAFATTFLFLSVFLPLFE